MVTDGDDELPLNDVMMKNCDYDYDDDDDWIRMMIIGMNGDVEVDYSVDWTMVNWWNLIPTYLNFKER